ncbi:MAG TPA: hypothetical protein VFI03_01055 [Solirubrobacterales bacterium]|nr:hypothetical protein [Solirubrobacterales bacterium]
MIRNLKALGLAVVAVLAMSAVVASAAQAEANFTASEYPAYVTGEQETGVHEFLGAGTGVTCTGAHFLSHALGGPSPDLTVTAAYTGCKDTTFGLSSTVTMNGCTYTFTTPTKVATDHYTGKVDLVCPAGKVVEVHVATCTLTISPKTELGTVTYTNKPAATPKKDVTLDIAVKGIPYKVDRGFLCPISSTYDTTHNDGEYTGFATVKAFNANTNAQIDGDVG